MLTQTDRVLETRKSIMEFHLINHPLDCPVCDQAGECYLQIYYMKHGLYDPRMVDEKVHKPKAVPLGPHVILDAERCILCSRCVRFCDEITGTGELGIFHRGDHSEIGLFPGRTLESKYSGNVVDICPVGALTDRDFRFRVRVWYLETVPLDLSGMRARLQHRRPRQSPSSPSRRGPSGGPAQAALQRGGEPLVDLRRGPLRVPLRRRRHAPAAPHAGRGPRAPRTSAGTRPSPPSPRSSATPPARSA